MFSKTRVLLCLLGAVVAIVATASPASAAGQVLRPAGDDWVCVSIDALGIGVCQGDPLPAAVR